jgi:lysophospholipase L1-like esterase
VRATSSRAALIALMAAVGGGLAGAPASASTGQCPPQVPDCPTPAPGSGHHKVHRLKPWNSRYLYRVQQGGAAYREPHAGARRKPETLAAGSWLPITCQVVTFTGGAPAVWDRIAGVGWVPDRWLKTYTDGRLAGSPTCTPPFPDHVWNLQPWRKDLRYRVVRTSPAWHQPTRSGPPKPHWVRRGTWVRVACQVRGARVAGSRLWDRVDGEFVPDARLKTWTDGRLAGAPRCHVPYYPSIDSGHYVALGDSYSSGLGAGNYMEALPPGRKKQCDRSYLAYARPLEDYWEPPRFLNDDTDFLACQGDVTSDVLTKQIPHMRRKATAVTITIGGNDMGFASILKACLLNSGCSDAVRAHFGPIDTQHTTRPLQRLSRRLGRVYGAIHRRAPHATVVVLGYPKVLGPEIDGCFGLSNDDLPMLHRAGLRLNQTIRFATERRGPNFHFASLAGVFAGHEACGSEADEWINSPRHLQYYREYFHPNYPGQQEIAKAVIRRLPRLFRPY